MVRFVETERRVDVAGAGGGGGQFVLNGDRVSVSKKEKFWRRVDDYTTM